MASFVKFQVSCFLTLSKHFFYLTYDWIDRSYSTLCIKSACWSMDDFDLQETKWSLLQLITRIIWICTSATLNGDVPSDVSELIEAVDSDHSPSIPGTCNRHQFLFVNQWTDSNDNEFQSRPPGLFCLVLGPMYVRRRTSGDNNSYLCRISSTNASAQALGSDVSNSFIDSGTSGRHSYPVDILSDCLFIGVLVKVEDALNLVTVYDSADSRFVWRNVECVDEGVSEVLLSPKLSTTNVIRGVECKHYIGSLVQADCETTENKM